MKLTYGQRKDFVQVCVTTSAELAVTDITVHLPAQDQAGGYTVEHMEDVPDDTQLTIAWDQDANDAAAEVTLNGRPKSGVVCCYLETFQTKSQRDGIADGTAISLGYHRPVLAPATPAVTAPAN